LDREKGSGSQFAVCGSQEFKFGRYGNLLFGRYGNLLFGRYGNLPYGES